LVNIKINFMKKYLKNISLILSIAFIMISCKKEAVIDNSEFTNVSLLSAYSTSQIDGEASLDLYNVTGLVSEAGIVWSTKSNPTLNDSKISYANLKYDQPLFLKLENLKIGTKYYIKAFLTINKITRYSETEIEFTHNFTNNWVRFESPKVESQEYISSENVIYSGFRGGINFYKIDKFTNIANESSYYPNFDQWDPQFFQGNNQKPTIMRFNPFVAKFNASPILEVTMYGGGYNKKSNGSRFYLKDFKIEGIDGYKWDPQYPGADAPTCGFGLNGKGYVLENLPNGRLWDFNINISRWTEDNKAPSNKSGKYLSYDMGERAFVMFEPSDEKEPQDVFYEYQAIENKWLKMKDFPGENRRGGISFGLKNKLYYGAGLSAIDQKPLRDIWEYDINQNTWAKKTDYPGIATVNLAAIGIDNFVYIGFGQQVLSNSIKGQTINNANDFWRFRP
jgi:hypothetical protein